MHKDPEVELEELGLLPTEAQVYLALIRNGALGASAIANVTKVPRSSVYPTLNTLIDKGLVEGGAGYGSRFSAVRAELALPNLIRREKEELMHRESVAKKLTEHLSSLAEPVEAGSEEVIEVIRSSRAAAERFEHLELEAERQIDIFTKPPYFSRTGNPALGKALRRGVQARSLYEKAALNDPGVKPYFASWIAAGEKARIYDGLLPHKLAIFDSKAVLVPLILPGEQMRTLLIRHPQLAESLSLAFQYIWDRSEPLVVEKQQTASTFSKRLVKHAPKTDHAGQRISRNGRRGHSAKK
jgi:sugar-specific transcriptional regulator TrmB